MSHTLGSPNPDPDPNPKREPNPNPDQVSHTPGELELELTIGKFKMVAMADSAFVADQWAQAITSITFTLTPTPHP